MNPTSIENPYSAGSHAHVLFNNLLPGKMSASRDLLRKQYEACKQLSNDWLNQGGSARSQADFEAEVIAAVFQYRFEQSVEVSSMQPE